MAALPAGSSPSGAVTPVNTEPEQLDVNNQGDRPGSESVDVFTHTYVPLVSFPDPELGLGTIRKLLIRAAHGNPIPTSTILPPITQTLCTPLLTFVPWLSSSSEPPRPEHRSTSSEHSTASKAKRKSSLQEGTEHKTD